MRSLTLSGRLIVAFLLPFLMSSFASGEALRNVSSEELLRRGGNLMHMNDYDSAYQCYKTVASRYPSASTLDEKIQGLDGIYGTLECNILMSDYRSAFDDLLLAEEIVNKNKLPKIRLNLYYGDFYIVLGSQTGKQSFLQMAVPYNRDAFNEALQANDDVAIYCAFGNLMNCCYVLNDFKSMAAEEKKMEHLAATSNDWHYAYSLLLLKALRAASPGEALGYYTQAEKLIPKKGYDRIRAGLYIDMAARLELTGRYAEALKKADGALRISYLHDLRDMRISALNAQESIYRNLGEEASAKAVKEHISELKDSLQAYLIIDDVMQLSNIRQQRAMERRVIAAEYRERTVLYTCIILAVLLIVMAVFVILLRRKNREIRRRSLYLLDRMRLLAGQPSEGAKEVLPEEEDTDISEENGIGEAVSEQEGEENEASAMSAETLAAIAADIDRVMASDAVFRPDFTLTTFARMIGRHPKTLSQVIRRHCGCTSPTLVNRRRITEACRRFDSPEYANYSAEGIGQSVGYGSRTTFTTNFRKITGLTVREYRVAASNQGAREKS